MRFAAIADIHGNALALEAVLFDIERAGIKQTVNLGDVFSGPLDAAGTARLLEERDFPTLVVIMIAISSNRTQRIWGHRIGWRTTSFHRNIWIGCVHCRPAYPFGTRCMPAMEHRMLTIATGWSRWNRTV